MIPGNKLDEHFITALEEVFELFQRKQADYGPHNISMSGERGLAIRLNDKIQRMLWLLDISKTDAQNESLRDTWLDIADYGIIGLLVHDGLWPEGDEDERATATRRVCKSCGHPLANP